MSDMEYVGQELEIFAHAVQWKEYYGSFIKPFLGERVLEVGAGLGATTSALHDPIVKEWVCLEPDPSFVKILRAKVQGNELPPGCHEKLGTVDQLNKDDLYDCILYIDVLEHIEGDKAELMIAASHLQPSGTLVVLSPAHQWLFTPFDQAIGHFRRYSKKSLAQLGPHDCSMQRLMYLDSAGALLSLVNKLFLRQSMPTVRQIVFWDRFVIPVSKVLDRICMFNLGKSVVAVWKRTA